MNDLRESEGRSAAAAEYVVGTLGAAEHDAFERALAVDRGLQAEVYEWQDRLLALTALAPAVEPSVTLWSRIDSACAAEAIPQRLKPARANDDAAGASRGHWWHRLGVWQSLTAAAVGACLVLAVQLADRPRFDGAPGYLAVLQAPDSRATGWLVQLQGDSLRLVPVGDTGTIPPGRAWQLWTKPEGASAPTSLGLVREATILELPLSALPAAGARQLFEITLEPETGSPTGRPTGPILYVGSTVAL